MKTSILTTGEITKQAIKVLDLMGFECWRNNNVRAVPGRTFTGKKGVPDVIGFERSSGKFLLAETKNKGDKMSDEQTELLTHAKRCGCHCFVAAVDKQGGFILNKF